MKMHSLEGNIDEVIRKHGAIPTVKNEENVVFMFSKNGADSNS